MSIGKEVGKSSAQVCLRWNIQRGVCVIPKTLTVARMRENLDANCQDWELSEDQMERINKLDKGFRFCKCPFWSFPDDDLELKYLQQ